jgi:hypothetical protein
MNSFKIPPVNFFTCTLLLFSLICNGQSTGDYRSNATLMNWDTSTDWQTWDATSSSWITANSSPDANHAQITIQQGHTVVINTSHSLDQLVVNGTLKNTSGALTIHDGPGDDLIIYPGGKLINEGTNASIVNLGQLLMNDSIINRATCTFINSGKLINDRASFKNTGKLINDTNSLLINNGDFLTGGAITFENGSRYQHNFNNAQAMAGTIPTASWKEGSVCEILACGNAFQPGALNQVFHHFIWNNSTQPHDFNLIANPNVVNGNFEIKNTNGKKLTYKGGSSGDLAIADSFKITGGIFVLTNGNASTVVKTSTYYQPAGTLDMSASGAASTIFVTSSFTHTGGILQRSGTATSNTIIVNGATPSTIESIGFRVGDPITFKINKEGTTGSCILSINKTVVLNPGTIFNLFDNTSVSADLQIDGTFNAVTNSWDLTKGVTGVNGNFINQSTLPVGNSSTLASLQFKAGSFYTHTGDGGEVVNASWSPTSTIHVTGMEHSGILNNGGQHFGNILWDCSKQQQPCTFGSPGFGVQGDFIIASTGQEKLRFPDCDFTIDGNLSVRNDAKLQLAAGERLYEPLQRVITINGTVSILNTASLQVGTPNAGDTTTVTTDSYRDYLLQLKKDFIYTSSTPLISYHHKHYPGNSNDEAYHLLLNFNGNAMQQLTLKEQSTGLVQLSPTEYIANNLYKLIVSGNGTHLLPQLDDVKAHSIQVDTSDTLDISQKDINIIQYPVLSYTGTPLASACNVNGTIDLGMNTLSDGGSAGLFQLQADATIRTKHPQGIDSIISSGCIQNTGNRIFDPAAHYVYNGNNNQVTGTGLPSLISGSLTIDNSTLPAAGGIALTKNTTITGALYLNHGKLLTTRSSTMIIGNTGVVLPTGGQAFSFVDGPVKKINLNPTSKFIFPTGNKSKWARIGITSKSASTVEFTAAYIVDNPTTIYNSLLDLDHISTKEYWKLDRANSTDAITVDLFWESGTYSGIYTTNPADLKIAHADATIGADHTWKPEEDNRTSTGNPAAGSIQATAILSDLNLFTFGSATSANPLPIRLLSFTGNSIAKGNLLNWATASEKSNHYFCIQRSVNGNQFSQIRMVNGHGNSTNLQYYSYLDSGIFNNTVYYRLKQVDDDGTYTYSSIVRIETADHEIQEVIAYPNPATTDDIHIITSNSVHSFRIYNLLGKIVFESHPGSENTEQIFTPDTSGIYFIKAITYEGKIITKRIIKG